MVQRSTALYDRAPWGGKSLLSTTFLATLWILAVVSRVGKYFFEWQGWDVLVGLSALMFGISLIRTLAWTKPMLNELPGADVVAAKRPGFWVRTVLLLLGLAITLFLSGLNTPPLCGVIGLVHESPDPKKS